MSDKLSRIQSYSLNRKAGNIKFVKLKEATKKKDKIDERIAAIKRDTKITFTGRENEISQLRHIYFSQKKTLTGSKEFKNNLSQNTAPPLPAFIGIKGEAGIGKSRLISEFLKPYKKNTMTGVSENHVQNPYSYFISLIKTYTAISDSDFPEGIKKKLKFSLTELSNYEKSKPDKKALLNSFNLLCHLLGIYTSDYRLKLPAEEQKIHLQLSIKYFIEAVAAKVNFFNEPLIIVCEDAHWMDDTSKSTLSYILNTLNISKNNSGQFRIIIFMLLYRPEFKIMKEAEFKTDFTQIVLEPLDYNSVQNILRSGGRNKAGKENLMLIPDETVKLLTERSEGNPLFIQEWIRMFGDKYKGVELHQIKNSKLHSEKENIEIPGSINLLINKRLERLSTKELNLLQYASVIGNEFSDILLKKTAKLLSDETDIEGVLVKLFDNRFIRKSDKAFGSERYFEFHHDVIREIVYETIPKENRKVIHKTTGQAIEDIYHNKIEQYYYVLCEHFEKGGAEEKITEYLEKAGDRARESFENPRAIDYYEKLSIITSETDTDKYSRIIFKKLQLYKLSGKWSEALDICRDLSNRNEFKKNDELNFQLNYLTADIYYNQSNYTHSIKLLSKMSKKYSNSSDKFSEITGLLCLNYYESGNPNKAEHYAKIFFNISSESNNKLNPAKAYEYFGLIERSRGNYKASVSYFQKSLSIYEKNNDIFKSAVLTNRIGVNYSYMSEYSKSLAYFERCKSNTQKNGDIREYINVIGSIGIILNKMGDTRKAFNIYKKRLILSKRINYTEAIASTYASIGNCYYNEKLFDDALANYTSALNIFEEKDMKTNIASMYCNIGLIHMHRGNYGDALKYFGLQMKINENLKSKNGMYLGYLNTANLYKKIKLYPDSISNYRKAIKLAKEMDSRLLLSIAYFNYAEVLFSTGDLQGAETNINFALEAEHNPDYKHVIFHFKLLYNVIQFNLELKKITFDSQNKLLSLNVSDLKSIVFQTELLLNEVTEDEGKAKVHYELWKMNKFLEENNMKVTKHKKLALKHFRLIYKKTADIEYQKFISELS